MKSGVSTASLIVAQFPLASRLRGLNRRTTRDAEGFVVQEEPAFWSIDCACGTLCVSVYVCVVASPAKTTLFTEHLHLPTVIRDDTLVSEPEEPTAACWIGQARHIDLGFTSRPCAAAAPTTTRHILRFAPRPDHLRRVEMARRISSLV